MEDDGQDLSLGPEADWAEYDAWREREVAAGRDPDAQYEPWDLEEPAEAARPQFGQGDEADVLPLGPTLVALTDAAAQDLGALSGDELVGVILAGERVIAREQYKQVLATAEFGRRHQAAFEGALARGVPAGVAPGGFPGQELAMELHVTQAEAGHRIDDAVALTSRLPRTLEGMKAGLIDRGRAGWISLYTRELSAADAAHADEVLAAAAPDLRDDQLARRAAALEMKLDPEAVKTRRERTKRCEQRVEARREASGNASLSAREMDTGEAIASKSFIDDRAARLRAGGILGPLGALRVLVLSDLTQGRDPLDRLRPPAADPADGDAPGPGAAGPDPDSWPGWGANPDDAPEDPGGDPPSPDGPAPTAPVPMPALINLTVPAGTLLGWSSAPAQAGTWGLLDREETQAIAGTAARHPRTRWCVTLTAPDGTAVAHGCARGQHPHLLDQLSANEGPAPPGHLAELLRGLNVTFTAIARDDCDHDPAEEHYTPSRKLRHLVQARTTTCDAPGCDNLAVHADLDHTVPWPNGPTSQNNLAPRCRTHHRVKQAPDWIVEQLARGVTRWTMPSGRTHITRPTRYDC